MILLIDNYDSFTHNLYQLIKPLSPSLEIVRNDRITTEQIAQINPEAIILSPGPGWPQDSGICLEVIERFHKQLPILGVCLGHQALALAFGGKVVKAPIPVHGKASLLHHKGEGLFKHIPFSFRVARYHSLLVDKHSLDNFEIHAETEDGLVMAIAHKSYPSYGVQFHPESYLSEYGAAIIKNYLTVVNAWAEK